MQDARAGCYSGTDLSLLFFRLRADMVSNMLDCAFSDVSGIRDCERLQIAGGFIVVVGYASMVAYV